MKNEEDVENKNMWKEEDGQHKLYRQCKDINPYIICCEERYYGANALIKIT